MFAVFPVMMLISAVGTMAFGGRGANRIAEVNEDRREYLRYLDEVDATTTETAAAQQVSTNWVNPAPDPAELYHGVPSWQRPAPTLASTLREGRPA